MRFLSYKRFVLESIDVDPMDRENYWKVLLSSFVIENGEFYDENKDVEVRQLVDAFIDKTDMESNYGDMVAFAKQELKRTKKK